jgi:predicted aconitase with swiveling domain
MKWKLQGRAIQPGAVRGVALVSREPVCFLGGIDPETGIVVEAGHELEGQCITGRVLVFPTGKGSTVGSYTIYRMAKGGTAPVAIVNRESEAIVAVGAIIALIPMVDQVDVSQIESGDRIELSGALLTVER